MKIITDPSDITKITSKVYFDLPEKKRAPIYFIVTRIIDIIVAIFALIILSPLLAVISLAIFIEDRHSPIYVDKRLGKDKKIFGFYKFRSMFVNASQMERNNKEVYKKLRSAEHKIENHPYVTKVGKFIRKASIDEIPQFINVIKGEMSVVGPRALKVDEESKFRSENPKHHKYLDALFEIKPGITGIWQISGRSKIDFEHRIRMEGYYARTYSVLNNILIMLKTPIAILRAETH
ncbi:multidrug MFS transporter [candidate division WWE3 bacterium CG10_big_fil_rev_8_21_14_0_10_32_10]|uniref:Multidrug MFS transporter n=1 Tax=candidate division WWE3 bacterium CG10_big_fil_rev_8_21_14_0_10_32_10 TaxID=1975090 RepID=A0A2H0R8Z3_UNCKA|nr:MAG: multidrug MFS transporter [candidate division WWE3 bacterium CG10_big_fil_rev_8_21_14_0_10_32_10]